MLQESLYYKGDVPDNAKPVCDDAKFIGITEMSINVHLPDSRVSGCVGRHGAISSFIRVIGIIETFGLFKGFQLSYDTVGVFGIVFRHPCLNTRSVKENHGCFFLVDFLADWFGQFNKAAEHGL